ncbi:cytochrome P450 [Nocardia jiangsuensis]|uniref:Cytochrome P450 n=1 Tax=Nocardia jiangsuensis TaxID=1691563 RepID=A0ABV8DMY3_9NOCA
MPDTVPVYRPDLYSRAAILDPHPHYARLRELGPVVRLPRHRAYALPRYAECKAVLRDHDTFASGGGVALNPVTNRMSRDTTLASDGADHRRRRTLLAHRMLPRALRTIQEDVRQRAAETVAAAVRAGTVDGVTLAAALPLSIVPDLVGWPRDGRDHLLDWAAATFDALGPLNGRGVRTAPANLAMLRYTRALVRDRALLPGSAGADVLRAADDGRIGPAEATALMIDYLAPSLDTTIGAISAALHLFATHPGQWEALRRDPGLVPNAVHEAVRYESPIRGFARTVRRPVELAGTPVPAGARVLVLYASANRDPREWTEPGTFDIHRDATRQLGFGYGRHGCAGQALARLEAEAVLTALAERVARIEVVGEPEWLPNNVIRRYARLPLRLVPAR